MDKYLVLKYDTMPVRASLNVFQTDIEKRDFEEFIKRRNLKVLYQGNNLYEAMDKLNANISFR